MQLAMLRMMMIKREGEDRHVPILVSSVRNCEIPSEELAIWGNKGREDRAWRGGTAALQQRTFHGVPYKKIRV